MKIWGGLFPITLSCHSILSSVYIWVILLFESCFKLGNLLWLQSGHNIEKVREKIRELTRLLCHIYPPSKVFAYVVEGLRSKNNRTRVECVDAIGYMVEEYGIEVNPTCCLDAFHFYPPLGAKNCFQ